MVVICLLLRRVPLCLACALPNVGVDNFKSAVPSAVFGFQSGILTDFVLEFFNLDFGEIRKHDGDWLLPLFHVIFFTYQRRRRDGAPLGRTLKPVVHLFPTPSCLQMAE
ncbi:hypothetical protein Adt_38147 [Abeliophyllum distichum]|uniref:Secreted protein n=1 Tax=Abeliophyllum distichum TaxID=126358 RepID=A0ABD1Q1G9_9LAMI